MKLPPSGLPSAHSHKWHSRRGWDQLGYLRVRSLGNPDWQRDTEWLAQLLVRQCSRADSEDRALYDEAVQAVRRYPRTSSGVNDEDAAWDEVLTPIDRILERRQARHMAEVRAAEASGIR